MFTGGGTLTPVDRKPPKFGPWPRDEDYWNVPCYQHTKPISDEVHREQLKEIGRKLDKLCEHMNVHLNSEQSPVAEWGGRVNTDPDVMLPIVPACGHESSQDNMAMWSKMENEGARRLAQFIKKAGLTEAFINSRRKEPAIQVVSGETVHSPLVMTEIKSTLIKVNLYQEQEIAWFDDQHGITWGISFILDAEVLILQIHTTKCPQIFGNFRIMLKFIHESPFKSFPQSFQMTVRDRLSAYTTRIANIMHLVQDGYMTRDGVAQIRVSIVSIDADTDQSCAMWIEQCKGKVPQQSAPQQKQQQQKTPQYSYSRFSVTNYTITSTKTSPKLLDSKRGSWHLVVTMNRTNADSRHKEYISVLIKRCDTKTVLDGCFEYFVELCLPHGPDGKRQTGHRRSGRITTGSELISNFIAKCQLEPYLKDNTLQFWWGIREVPIR